MKSKNNDIEFVFEQRRFTCIMPIMIVYCDDINKNATIPLTNSKMSQLLQSNFQEIDNYEFNILIQMSEIDELSNFVIPQKKFPVSMQPCKQAKKEKSLRKSFIMKNPYIKQHSYHHIIKQCLYKLANIIPLMLIFSVQLAFVSKIHSKLHKKLYLNHHPISYQGICQSQHS
ncbi:unnamed protein product (macronuclear) [Paramecium tetraurelia]|uniref:Transmembrane protein n=1 Tax=Paramecium tetraurelia TaxID=5888 RepID=A0C2J3_PARTE|nr:uncharacterized protein GSPATT00034488001 [Paramecium tetraurelia]CAK65010.1 unnamed protein product [Paramecium tetraurelia]|eukprot:XP_001432407.1 hypothetical protein (macronuclear) [Paramecium tetraurelia strain d4-2]